MRSRNGYFNLIFSICAIIFITTNLYSDEYIISYRYVVKNAILIDSSLEVSHAMVKCDGKRGLSLYLKTYGSKNLKKILLKNTNLFSLYMNKLGMQVQSNGYNTEKIANSLTVLTLKPLCFTVNFNQNFVKITALSQP